MSKYAPDFPLIENEAYDTPPDAVLPLLPHLPTGFDFVEICAGAGQLVDALEKGGGNCVLAIDKAPRRLGIQRRDALTLTAADVWPAELIISNLPHADRDLMHSLIWHAVSLAPSCWFLIDVDWLCTAQAYPFMTPGASCLRRVVLMRRIKWIADTADTGKINYAWLEFGSPSPQQATLWPNDPQFSPRKRRIA